MYANKVLYQKFKINDYGVPKDGNMSEKYKNDIIVEDATTLNNGNSIR